MAYNQVADVANAAAHTANGMSSGQMIGILILAGLLGAVGQGARAIVGLKKINDEALASNADEKSLFIAARLNVSLVVGFIAGVVAALSLGISRLLSAKPDDVQLFLGIAAAGYAGVDFVEAFTRNLGYGGAPQTGAGSRPGRRLRDDKTRAKLSPLRRNQIEAYRAARGQGLSDLAARALVANMTGESLAKPNDCHWDVHHMSQGIVQWDPSRAEAIRRQFGKLPKDMTVTEQTIAAIWEIRTASRFARTNRALEHGESVAEMMDALVRNYEVPANPDREIQKRLAFFEDLETIAEFALV